MKKYTQFISRNIFLFALITFYTIMCAAFKEPSASQTTLVVSLILTPLLVFLTGKYREDSKAFLDELPFLIVIGAVSGMFGISIVSQTLVTLIIITISVTLYNIHKSYIKKYDILIEENN